MEALVRHLVEPIVGHPDDVQISVVDGDAALIFEMTVHDDDVAIFKGDDGRMLRYVRTILSAAAGSRKATLDLVDSDVLGEEE